MQRAGSGLRAVGLALAHLVTFVLASGLTVAGEASPGFRCEVIAEERGSSLIIRGQIFAARDISGRYTITASRTGSGTSNVEQTGAFQAGPESPAPIGMIVLSGPGTTSATLTVSWAGGSTICSLR